MTATTPGLHPPLETITEDLRNFGLVQISHKFERGGKKVKLDNEVSKKYEKAREVTQCISRFGPAFRRLSCTPPCSLGTALTGVAVVQPCRLGALQAFVRLFSLFQLKPGRK